VCRLDQVVVRLKPLTVHPDQVLIHPDQVLIHREQVMVRREQVVVRRERAAFGQVRQASRSLPAEDRAALIQGAGLEMRQVCRAPWADRQIRVPVEGGFGSARRR
jgi:hypothetical protein